jgi:hypothetical protein
MKIWLQNLFHVPSNIQNKGGLEVLDMPFGKPLHFQHAIMKISPIWWSPSHESIFTLSAVFFQILNANRDKTQRIVKWPIAIIPIINIQIQYNQQKPRN